jgi:hypothetical protein
MQIKHKECLKSNKVYKQNKIKILVNFHSKQNKELNHQTKIFLMNLQLPPGASPTFWRSSEIKLLKKAFRNPIELLKISFNKG